MISQFDNLRLILGPLYTNTNNSYNTINTQPSQNLEALLTNVKTSSIKGIQDASGVYFNTISRPNKVTIDISANDLANNARNGVNTYTFSNLSTEKVTLNPNDLSFSPAPTTTAAAPLGYYVHLARSIYMAITTSANTLANIQASAPAIATTVFNAIPKNKTAFTSAAGTVPVNPTLVFKSDGNGMLA